MQVRARARIEAAHRERARLDSRGRHRSQGVSGRSNRAKDHAAGGSLDLGPRKADIRERAIIEGSKLSDRSAMAQDGLKER